MIKFKVQSCIFGDCLCCNIANKQHWGFLLLICPCGTIIAIATDWRPAWKDGGGTHLSGGFRKELSVF